VDGFSLASISGMGFHNQFYCGLMAVGFLEDPTMLTTMTEEDWTIVLKLC